MDTYPPFNLQIERVRYREPEKNLWSSCLQLALLEAARGKREAWHWLTSTVIEVGSFRWICYHALDLPDPDRIITAVLQIRHDKALLDRVQRNRRFEGQNKKTYKKKRKRAA